MACCVLGWEGSGPCTVRLMDQSTSPDLDVRRIYPAPKYLNTNLLGVTKCNEERDCEDNISPAGYIRPDI